MESLENSDPISAMDDHTISRKPDRATLGKAESEKVDRWLKQINESSKGFLALSKSDIVNFLIREHRDVFLPKELLRIRSDNYDPIRHINWIMPQLKKAMSENDTSRINDLQKELRGIELSAVANVIAEPSAPPAKPRGQRKMRPRANPKTSSEEA